MDAFDAVFSGKGVTGGVRRKAEDGITKSVRLTGDGVPAGFTLADFADAAAHGAMASKRGTDRGASLSLSKPVSGAAARSAVLALGDPEAAPAEGVPPATRKRGQPVGANGAAG